jgi:hypothetical protein
MIHQEPEGRLAGVWGITYLLDMIHQEPGGRQAGVEEDILGRRLMVRSHRLNTLQVVVYCLPLDSLLLQRDNPVQQGAQDCGPQDNPLLAPLLGNPFHRLAPLLGTPSHRLAPLLGNSTIILVISENNIIAVSSLFIENLF